jgi:transposase
MSKPKLILIKETKSALKALLKTASPLIAPRIRMLQVEQEFKSTGISRRDLADRIGVDPNSITNWRALYFAGGIDAITSHKKTGFKPSVFEIEEHLAIEQKLKDPKNGLRGYVELLNWIEAEFKKEIKYNTLLKYCIKNFGSSVKVARKSHIKKDEEAVIRFKKTSVQHAKTSAMKKQQHSKK